MVCEYRSNAIINFYGPRSQLPKMYPSTDFMNTMKVFVGTLPPYVTEKEIYDLFRRYGPISSVHMIKHKNTNVFKGCAFINYTDRSSGEAAIKALNNTSPFPDVCVFLYSLSLHSHLVSIYHPCSSVRFGSRYT